METWGNSCPFISKSKGFCCENLHTTRVNKRALLYAASDTKPNTKRGEYAEVKNHVHGLLDEEHTLQSSSLALA